LEKFTDHFNKTAWDWVGDSLYFNHPTFLEKLEQIFPEHIYNKYVQLRNLL